MTFDPISLAMRALGGGWKLVKGAAKWASHPIERALLIACAAVLAWQILHVAPNLRSDIQTLETRVNAEVDAHLKTKEDYRKAMLHAEEKARAAVDAEMERQGKNATIAITDFRGNTGDLAVRADRLRNHFGGATVGGATSGPDLPAAVAHTGGASHASANLGLSGPAGGDGAGRIGQGSTCPATLIAAGIAMSIDERRIATEQAYQLDAILKLDALNAGPNAGAAPHE